MLAGGAELSDSAPRQPYPDIIAMRADPGITTISIAGLAGGERRGPGIGIYQVPVAGVRHLNGGRFAQGVQLQGQGARGLIGPADPLRQDSGAGAGQGLIKCMCQFRPSLPECSVSLGQCRAIMRQGGQVAPVRNRQHSIEVPPAFRCGSGSEAQILRQKGHCEPLAHVFGKPGRGTPVQPDLFFLSRDQELNRDLMVAAGVADLSLQPETGSAEPDYFLVERSMKGTEEHRVINGFQQVGLALAIVPQQRNAGRRKNQLRVVKISKTANRELFQPHYCTVTWRETVSP